MESMQRRKWRSKKEEAAKWKGITMAKYAALTDVTKKSLENAKQVKFMQSKQACREYLRGTCKRGKDCKSAHGDVSS